MTVAYTLNGEPIAYPANVIALRAKKMKAKGAPELLYKDGIPLVLSPDGDIAAEIRELLGDQLEDGEIVRIKLEPPAGLPMSLTGLTLDQVLDLAIGKMRSMLPPEKLAAAQPPHPPLTIQMFRGKP